jgi:hypothetical protein
MRCVLGAEAIEQRSELHRKRRFDTQRRAWRKRGKLEARAREQQPLHPEPFAEQAVVPAFAVCRVADDRVRRACEVTPQLVPATGVRRQFDQCVA